MRSLFGLILRVRSWWYGVGGGRLNGPGRERWSRVILWTTVLGFSQRAAGIPKIGRVQMRNRSCEGFDNLPSLIDKGQRVLRLRSRPSSFPRMPTPMSRRAAPRARAARIAPWPQCLADEPRAERWYQHGAYAVAPVGDLVRLRV